MKRLPDVSQFSLRLCVSVLERLSNCFRFVAETAPKSI